MATKVPVVAPVDLGRGIVRNEQKKKYEVDLSEFVDGDTITYEGGKLKGQPQSSGLDCSAIGALKTVAMDKTIKVLGKKGDECVQVAVLDSIFQDVGVGISASKYTGFVGDSFNVKITVTNTGEGTNENTTLSIIKPSLGSYTIQNQSHTSQGAGSVTKVSDTEYTIRNLAKGGTVIVTFDVIGSSHGTYQFSATVDPKSALDTNATNHRATISLNVNTKQDTNYVATTDCPFITATDVDTNTVLAVRTATNGANNAEFSPGRLSRDLATNVYWSKNNLSNVRIKLTNAKTVVVFGRKSYENSTYKRCFINGNRKTVMDYDAYSALGKLLTNNVLSSIFTLSSSEYTFTPATGIVTLNTNEYNNVVIMARPGGTNCSWQFVYLQATQQIGGCSITATPNTGVSYVEQNDLSEYNEVPARVDIGSTTGDVLFGYIGYRNRKPVFTIPQRTARTYTITASNSCNLRDQTVAGNVSFTPTDATNATLTVSNTATPSDSVKRELFEVAITE